MTTIAILNNKVFMNSLLKENIFDEFEVRNIEVQTFVKFEITGLIEKDYFSLDEQELITNKFCLWKELRPIVFQLIKGNKSPKSLKVVFSYSASKINEIDENAAALFLNISFENGKILCTTGSSEKIFSLDRKVESSWENYIIAFFKSNNINI